MKKIFIITCLLIAANVPSYAILETPDYNSMLSKEQYKLEKAKLKYQLKCQKNPAKCAPTTPVAEQTMTLGIVQKEIKLGTSQDVVAMALGSPNIVTQDSDGKETWIYDKVASITSYNSSGFGIGAGGVGGGGGFNGGGGGILGVGYQKNQGVAQTTQKTLTVVIKFNKQNNVESFTYHMSKF